MSWFDRLFGKSKAGPSAAPSRMQAPPLDAFTAARSASREVLGVAMRSLQDPRGIHLESLFCALGALAGWACQDSVRARAMSEGRPAEAYFTVTATEDGKKYYLGDALNQPLAEDRVSIWSLVAGAAAHDGAQRLPDLHEIFRHNASALGGEEFGVPRLPREPPVHGKPIDYARSLWPAVRPLLVSSGEPRMWPVAIGLAIQELMAQTRGQVPPEIVARIVMESAVPVAKIPIDG